MRLPDFGGGLGLRQSSLSARFPEQAEQFQVGRRENRLGQLVFWHPFSLESENRLSQYRIERGFGRGVLSQVDSACYGVYVSQSSLVCDPPVKRDLLSACAAAERAHRLVTSLDERKKRGQVFTPPSVCRFMAGQISAFPQTLRLLDPGAGVGALTAAVCERMLELSAPRRLDVHLFESDKRLVGPLTQVMDDCGRALSNSGHSLTYQVHAEDFIAASSTRIDRQRSLIANVPIPGPFDVIIANPPYFKLNKKSQPARLMAGVTYGQPNIYAFFLAAACEHLREDGELVAITPRSFCSGLYFREFRRWFFQRMALTKVHLFESRTDTFKESNVLQESIITVSRRLGDCPREVDVTRSFGRDLPAALRPERVSVELILSRTGRDVAVRIPEKTSDTRILEEVEQWPERFSELGLRVSTGPVVMFRATKFLLDRAEAEASVPLLGAHNIRPFAVQWPVYKKKWPTAFRDVPASRKHLITTRNCVLLKRFSAKEEQRRLTAGCLFADQLPHPRLALENHINYICHAHRDLTKEEVLGIAAIFNSVILDRYFRSLSGNTQVNASDIRSMRFPGFDSLRRIGARLGTMTNPGPVDVEAIVVEELGIRGHISQDVMQDFGSEFEIAIGR